MSQYTAWPLLISLFALAMSLLFYRLDRRNRALVRYAEITLREFEKDFAEKLGSTLAPQFVHRQRFLSFTKRDIFPI